jgi:Relaxase/Mobilisation nuclease domain
LIEVFGVAASNTHIYIFYILYILQKMIANQLKNRSFRSTLEYVLGKEKATIIDGNMGGTTPRQLAKEFAAARKFRPNLIRACSHIILAIPHRDDYHETLDDERFALFAKQWLQAMGYLDEGIGKSQYIIARHRDTDHEHIHIVASRIRMDGSVVSDSWDYRRSEVVLRKLEKEFGLEPVPCSSESVAVKLKEKYDIDATVSSRKAQTRKQKKHPSNKPPVTQLLADIIDEATQDSPTVTELISRLQQRGVTVHPQFSTLGNFKEAIAFELDGVRVAGNKLGSCYSFPGLLKKRGVNYESDRDLPAIVAAAKGEMVGVDNQDEMSNAIAPVIRMFWDRMGGKEIEGTYYTLRKDGEILKLARKGGKEIAQIPVNPDAQATGGGLTAFDVERMLELQRILRGWERKREVGELEL